MNAAPGTRLSSDDVPSRITQVPEGAIVHASPSILTEELDYVRLKFNQTFVAAVLKRQHCDNEIMIVTG